MSIWLILQCWCYVVWTSLHFERLFSTQPISLVVEEISRNRSAVQIPITDFINQKEKHVSIRHNSILTLMKPWAALFCIDMMYMVGLDMKYFSVIWLCIYHEKPAVKTRLTRMEHFFAKNLNYCPCDIIWNSVALKCQCLQHN